MNKDAQAGIAVMILFCFTLITVVWFFLKLGSCS
jgi:hypothetical protein